MLSFIAQDIKTVLLAEEVIYTYAEIPTASQQGHIIELAWESPESHGNKIDLTKKVGERVGGE